MLFMAILLEQWQQVAKFLSARGVDANAAFEPLDQTSMGSLWSTLHSKLPEDFGDSASRRYDWNVWRAEIFMAQWNPAASLPHLNELVASEPDRLRFRTLRARANEALQRWPEMAEDLRVATKLQPTDRVLWVHLAAAEIAAGNQLGFQTACRHIADLLDSATDIHDTEWAIRVCCYGPCEAATLARLRTQFERVLSESESAAENDDFGTDWNVLRTRGLLAFREGRYEEALALLSHAAEPQALIDATWIFKAFLAMSHQAVSWNHANCWR